MDNKEERQTELLWRRIVDVRSREATIPLDDRASEEKSGELSELQRLAEDTAQVLNAEIPLGSQAGRDRLIKYIRANPVSNKAVSTKPGVTPRRFSGPGRFSQRALLIIAILLFAVAFAIAAVNYIVPSFRDGCGTGGDSSVTTAKPAVKKAHKNSLPAVKPE